MPTPAQHGALAQLAERLAQAGHGQKTALIAEAATQMAVTAQTVHRWLSEGHRATGRKRRKDAGRSSLSPDTLRFIAAQMREGNSEAGKARMTLERAVDIARQNGRLKDPVDFETGEIMVISNSTVARALKTHGLHPSQLTKPAAHQPLASPHPNWMWQVDASVCVVYYLPGGGYGLCELKKAEHYKNKPENIKAIEQFRVIRYVATDHASGVIRVRYYPHAESGAHTVHFLCWLMAPKADANDPFHGRPAHVMVDPGATASGMVRRFCVVTGVKLIVNEAHNPRAKGQVEQANNLWEGYFESALKNIRHRVTDFAALNQIAHVVQLHFNATRIHTRHKMTRFAAWMLITPAQLIITAPMQQLLALATKAPTTPLVAGDLTVAVGGERWGCKDVPNLAIGQKLTVMRSPFVADGMVAEVVGEDGHKTHVPLDKITAEGQFGFASNAATVGLEYKSPADTAAVRAQRELDRLVTGEQDATAAKKRRGKKDFVPFGGEVNPYRDAETAPVVPFIPRRGTPMTPPAVEVVARRLTASRAVMRIADALGDKWDVGMADFITRKYKDGIGEDELARLIEQMTGNGGQDHAAIG
jgi:hypothetical protein